MTDKVSFESKVVTRVGGIAIWFFSIVGAIYLVVLLWELLRYLLGL